MRPVPLRIIHLNGKQDKFASSGLLKHASDRPGRQERHIAKTHQCLRLAAIEQGPCLHQRMARSLLRHLKRKLQICSVFVVLLHLIGAVPHDNRLDGGKAVNGIKHMVKHGAPCKRLKNLGQSGMHALAHAGSKNDDIHECARP